MTNLQLFGVGAAIGGTVGLGLSLFVRYIVVPQMFAEPLTVGALGTPSAPVTTPTPTPAQTQTVGGT